MCHAGVYHDKTFKEQTMKKLKIGFVAGFMDGFSTVGLDLFSCYQKELDRLSKALDFEITH